jgi:hypothetical protein
VISDSDTFVQNFVKVCCYQFMTLSGAHSRNTSILRSGMCVSNTSHSQRSLVEPAVPTFTTVRFAHSAHSSRLVLGVVMVFGYCEVRAEVLYDVCMKLCCKYRVLALRLVASLHLGVGVGSQLSPCEVESGFLDFLLLHLRSCS